MERKKDRQKGRKEGKNESYSDRMTMQCYIGWSDVGHRERKNQINK